MADNPFAKDFKALPPFWQERVKQLEEEAESNDRQSTMLSTKLQEMTAKYDVAETARKKNLEQLAAAQQKAEGVSSYWEGFYKEKLAIAQKQLADVASRRDQVIDTIYSYYDTANVLHELGLPEEYTEWLKMKGKEA